MSPQLQNIDVDGPTSVAPVTTNETVVATLGPQVNVQAGRQVILEGMVSITPGAGTTGIQLRVRRGSTVAGALVGAMAQTDAAAGVQQEASVQVDDTPGEVAGQNYVLTVQQIAATGNGNVASSNLQATWLA